MTRGVKAEKAEESTASAMAQVLGANLEALMTAHPELGSNPKLAKKTGLGTGTISRMRNGEVNANLDTLDRLARAFHIEPWQLLVRGMEPGNLPVIQAMSAKERKLMERVKELAKEMN